MMLCSNLVCFKLERLKVWYFDIVIEVMYEPNSYILICKNYGYVVGMRYCMCIARHRWTRNLWLVENSHRTGFVVKLRLFRFLPYQRGACGVQSILDVPGQMNFGLGYLVKHCSNCFKNFFA